MDFVYWNAMKENFIMSSFKRLLCAVSAVFVLFSLSACAFPTKIIGSFPEPEDTVKEFFDSVCAGDFEKSDTYLDEVSLVLKNQPDDIFSEKLYAYLLQSYSYTVEGQVKKSQFSAECSISFTYLNFNLLLDDLKAGSTKLGKRYIAESKEGYVTSDENGISLTDEGAKKIAAEVLDAMMTKPEKYYSTNTYDIQLRYNSYKWLVYIPDDLFDAICGNYESVK